MQHEARECLLSFLEGLLTFTNFEQNFKTT
jgi:hypothetical protein